MNKIEKEKLTKEFLEKLKIVRKLRDRQSFILLLEEYKNKKLFTKKYITRWKKALF